MIKPRVCVLKTDGVNCDKETVFAFQKAGASVNTLLLNDLYTNKTTLQEFEILVIPGGFSYGDDIQSGKVWSIELLTMLEDQLSSFIERDTLILGICNGFQVLARTGLLPFKKLGTIDVTLMHNDSGTFECRWVNMTVTPSPCIFTTHMVGKEVTFQAAHAEGKFFASQAVIDELEEKNLVALKYSFNHQVTDAYPANPNGSMHAIAGICDASGKIFGLMPHPERFVQREQHPNWRRETFDQPHGLQVFTNAVRYFE